MDITEKNRIEALIHKNMNDKFVSVAIKKIETSCNCILNDYVLDGYEILDVKIFDDDIEYILFIARIKINFYIDAYKSYSIDGYFECYADRELSGYLSSIEILEKADVKRI